MNLKVSERTIEWANGASEKHPFSDVMMRMIPARHAATRTNYLFISYRPVFFSSFSLPTLFSVVVLFQAYIDPGHETLNVWTDPLRSDMIRCIGIVVEPDRLPPKNKKTFPYCCCCCCCNSLQQNTFVISEHIRWCLFQLCVSPPLFFFSYFCNLFFFLSSTRISDAFNIFPNWIWVFPLFFLFVSLLS